MATTVDLNEIEEFEDSLADLEVKIKKLAHLVGESKHLVVFTGAGISTSASIPDYRGPNGVWTFKAHGKKTEDIPFFDKAAPTPCHMTLKELQDRNILKYIISQNDDGLHRRSGILKERISELQGNCYLEGCWKCGQETIRHVSVKRKPKPFNGKCGSCSVQSPKPKFCHCMHTIKCIKCKTTTQDFIMHPGEKLPTKESGIVHENSKNADVMIVLGSSLSVSSDNSIPEETVEKGGKLVIVNVQKTPFDGSAHVRIFAKTDIMLMKELSIPIPQFLPHRTIYIGNKHKLVSPKIKPAEQEDEEVAASADALPETEVKKEDEWVVYLHSDSGTDLYPFIAYVKFHLHPSSNYPVVGINVPPYEVTRIGSRTYEVNIVVVLNNGIVSEYKHELNFSQEDTYTKHTLYLQQTVSDEVEEGVKQ